jgi:hypothetical protein
MAVGHSQAVLAGDEARSLTAISISRSTSDRDDGGCHRLDDIHHRPRIRVEQISVIVCRQIALVTPRRSIWLRAVVRKRQNVKS